MSGLEYALLGIVLIIIGVVIGGLWALAHGLAGDPDDRAELRRYLNGDR